MTKTQWVVIALVLLVFAAAVAFYWWAVVTVLNYFHMPALVLVALCGLVYLITVLGSRTK